MQFVLHAARVPVGPAVERGEDVVVAAEFLRGGREAVQREVLAAESLDDRQCRAAIVDLVGAADVDRARLHQHQLVEQRALALQPRNRRTAVVLEDLECVTGELEHGHAELVLDLGANVEMVSLRRHFQHMMQDARHQGDFVGTMARQDHGDVRRMRLVRHRSLDRRIRRAVLGGEREGVIDIVAVAAHGMPRNLCVCSDNDQRGWARQ